MKAKTASPETAVLTAERKLHNTWVYIKRHWQLYLLFLLPAVALTLVFKYAPMGGVLIAFQKYNPFKGIWGSEWVGCLCFHESFSSFLICLPLDLHFTFAPLNLALFTLIVQM